MAMSLTRGMNAIDVWDVLASLINTEMSIGRYGREALDEILLFDHFEAITVADLGLEYTETNIGGAGTVALYLDDEPSVVQLGTGGVANNGYRLETDRTVSLLRLGGQTLKINIRMRLSLEARALVLIGLLNVTTNLDAVLFSYDVNAGAPENDGALQCYVAGAPFNVAATLASTEDLTLYHDYRLEFEPGVAARFYFDDVLFATQAVAIQVPDDQSFVVYLNYSQRGAGAAGFMYVDSFRVWSE